jgi:hypothetical protein
VKPFARVLVGAVAAAIAGATFAQYSGQQIRDSAADSIDFSPKALEELPLQLPPAPKAGDLIEFDPGRPATLRFFVDSASLTVGTDGIVRFTVVVRGDGATSNVSYEGIRCRTRERKVYAYGRADGTWHAAQDPQWATIAGLSSDGHRFVLYNDYFCPARQIIATAREGMDALRRGGHPRATESVTSTPIRR